MMMVPTAAPYPQQGGWGMQVDPTQQNGWGQGGGYGKGMGKAKGSAQREVSPVTGRGYSSDFPGCAARLGEVVPQPRNKELPWPRTR